MCTVLTALSAGLSLYQGYAQGQAAQAQAEAQAAAYEQNAQNARVKAHDAIERGGLEELKHRRNLAKQLGNQRAGLATAGIDINSGSALDVRNASIAEGEYDAEVIRFNAARERWGYISDAENLEAQAAGARASGKAAARNALFGGIISAGLGIAGGAANSKSSPLTEKTPTDYNFYRDDIKFNEDLGIARGQNTLNNTINRYNSNTPINSNFINSNIPYYQTQNLYKWNKTTKRIK